MRHHRSSPTAVRLRRLLPFLALAAAAAGCSSAPERRGVVWVAGVPFPTEAPVVAWMDEGGYDAHLERCWFTPERVLPERPVSGCDVPRRYGPRSLKSLPEAERAAAEAAGGLDLPAAQAQIDQFVIHYDVCLTSKQCFKVLHDLRGLSVHFLLDLDGTVYQTLDLAHRARHATVANDRSIGVEIANMGAYGDPAALAAWYEVGSDGSVSVKAPKDSGVRTPGFRASPARPGLFQGMINGNRLHQYDFTEAQYDSLAKLVRTLHEALPRIRPGFPRAPDGSILDRVLTPAEFSAFSGILGHWHVQKNKSDPGPAFDWERLLDRASPASPTSNP